MGTFIDIADLDPFATIDPVKASEMISDAEAQAVLAAPCLLTLNTAPVDETADELALRTVKIAAVKAVLRSAILRWHESGTGAVQTQTVGPFGATYDTRTQRRGMFWPTELAQLQKMCTSGAGGAFSVDTAFAYGTHAPWCSTVFGALYCSCGADIAGYPIYELV